MLYEKRDCHFNIQNYFENHIEKYGFRKSNRIFCKIQKKTFMRINPPANPKTMIHKRFLKFIT